MFTACDRDRKSANCGTGPAPSARNKTTTHNPVWQSLATRPRATGASGERRLDLARANQPAKDDDTKELTEEEKRDYQYHKEHQCSNQPDASQPQRKPFTQREIGRAMFGLQNAKSIVSKAYGNLGQRDPYHLRKAEKTFGKPVSFATLDSHVLRIKSKLESLVVNQNLFAATCDEKQCNDGTHNFVAVTLDDLSGILLCPFFFLQGGRTLATTFIHEAGHMANIDVNWAPGNEKYCRPDDVIECDNVCPLTGENLLENVDAWMRLIYCFAMSS
jgi:hypothetical protein